MIKAVAIFMTLCLLVPIGAVMAQQVPEEPEFPMMQPPEHAPEQAPEHPVDGQAPEAAGAAGPAQPWSPMLVQYLSGSILVFTLLVLALSTALLWRKDASAQDILRLFGIVSIIGMSTLLLVAGYSNDQLTPIVGLFGAIAGYLLGREGKQPGA
ncbi:MAG: hypothetical protein RJQ08_07210 [Salinisphaeraceae bacterium]